MLNKYSPNGNPLWTNTQTAYGGPAMNRVPALDAATNRAVENVVPGLAAVNLADGKPLWSTNFSTRYNASSPVVQGQTLVYAGSSQPTRAVKLEPEGEKLTAGEVWSNRDSSVIYNTPVVKDGLVFGLS